ncbi:hypothetical protein JOM56_007066 [Amanita muscaria]
MASAAGTIAPLFAGPAFVASILNWGLLGVLCLQIYAFSTSFPNERLGIRIFVYTLLVLELCQTIFSTIWAWDVLVGGWGDPQAIAHISWSAITIPVTEGIVSIIVQTFFAWRIFVLRRRNWLFGGVAVLIVLIAFMQGLSAVVNGIRFALSLSVPELNGYRIGVSVCVALCDDCVYGLTRYSDMAGRLPGGRLPYRRQHGYNSCPSQNQLCLQENRNAHYQTHRSHCRNWCSHCDYSNR